MSDTDKQVEYSVALSTENALWLERIAATQAMTGETLIEAILADYVRIMRSQVTREIEQSEKLSKQ